MPASGDQPSLPVPAIDDAQPRSAGHSRWSWLPGLRRSPGEQRASPGRPGDRVRTPAGVRARCWLEAPAGDPRAGSGGLGASL